LNKKQSLEQTDFVEIEKVLAAPPALPKDSKCNSPPISAPPSTN